MILIFYTCIDTEGKMNIILYTCIDIWDKMNITFNAYIYA